MSPLIGWRDEFSRLQKGHMLAVDVSRIPFRSRNYKKEKGSHPKVNVLNATQGCALFPSLSPELLG